MKKIPNTLIIDQIYFRENKMYVYGKIDLNIISKEEFKLLINNSIKTVQFYDLTNDWNEDGLYNFCGFNFKVDVNEDWNLRFLGTNNVSAKYNHGSIFTNLLPRSYHHVNDRTIYLKKDILINKKRNFFRSFLFELENEFSILLKGKIKSLFARQFIKLSRIFKRKELWFISDRIAKADDNGEHFFKYLVQNYPDIKCYYVLNSKSADYNRLAKIGKVIDQNSFKYKMLFHIADYVVSSHAENYIFNPFGTNGKYLEDQYYFKFIFLQHGIIKDDLSKWLNVNTKKIDMFVTSSEKEYKSLLNCKYYYGENIVKLTGLARFDSLIEKKNEITPKKQIMVSFTWRNNLRGKTDKKTGKREYNIEFKNSQYFININKFLNDENLISTLKENDYTIKFIPHPNLLTQLDDFEKNDYVIFEENNVDYQKEFCENSLLITDYSSVFFDFAYLKKPVIFFQPDRDEFYENAVYDKGYFSYDEDGFGKVTFDYESLVNETIKCIKNDCKLEEKYEKRIDEFYTFNDQNNCKRIYENIKNIK